MKIVVVGGTGMIGSKLVSKLWEAGHEVVSASPSSGINTLTGEGLAGAIAGASVVVDVSNSPSLEDQAVKEFFMTSTANLLAEEAAAGVGHHVALSVVGTDRLSESGYFRAKIAQEELIGASSVPHTIVHATQFFEFVKSIAEAATDGDTVRLAPALVQPIAGDEVAATVAHTCQSTPLEGIVEVAGPQRFHLEEFVRHGLIARGDPHTVVSDPEARYFGAQIHERTLLPSANARKGQVHFRDWLAGKAEIGQGAGIMPLS